jgi:hypothetical protein
MNTPDHPLNLAPRQWPFAPWRITPTCYDIRFAEKPDISLARLERQEHLPELFAQFPDVLPKLGVLRTAPSILLKGTKQARAGAARPNLPAQFVLEAFTAGLNSSVVSTAATLSCSLKRNKSSVVFRFNDTPQPNGGLHLLLAFSGLEVYPVDLGEELTYISGKETALRLVEAMLLVYLAGAGAERITLKDLPTNE